MKNTGQRQVAMLSGFEFIERNRLVMEGRSVRLGTVLRDRKPAVRLNAYFQSIFLDVRQRFWQSRLTSRRPTPNLARTPCRKTQRQAFLSRFLTREMSRLIRHASRRPTPRTHANTRKLKSC